MATQRYSVTPHPIETLLTCVKPSDVARRPFVDGAARIEGMVSDFEAIIERLQVHCSDRRNCQLDEGRAQDAE